MLTLTSTIIGLCMLPAWYTGVNISSEWERDAYIEYNELKEITWDEK